jgi:AsmA protein
MVADIARAGAFGGTISGQAVVNGRNGLSLGGDISARGVALQPLLTDFADIDRLVGNADLRVKYLMAGNSLDALMRSMSGEAQASIGQGELLGLDLGGMIRNLDVGYRGEGAKTVFNAITASATIAGGVASNTDLNFDAPLLRATGSGTVDIGNQSVSYRIVPVALTGGNGITVPVIVEGPWSDVSVRPDLEAILNQNLAAEREAIEQQVRSQAEEALRRELGVDTSTTGGDVEQAVRDRVDQQADELRNQVGQQLLEGLGGLLGGGN